MKRIAVVGAGTMARIRTRALLATAGATVCGVATRHRDSAKRFDGEMGLGDCLCVDDFRKLGETEAEAVLVEVPHEAQQKIVVWALESQRHVLVGGPPAISVAGAEQIRDLAQQNHLVVEAGYQARYSAVWETAREMISGGELGELVAARSIALWGGDPASWYYNQRASGGMPLTHMTYCFINPVRWLLGRPTVVSALANRKNQKAAEMIAEESRVANILFANDVPYSLTAGFVKPGTLPSWSVTLIGTEAALELQPTENGLGTLTVYHGAETELLEFDTAGDPFEIQARTFLRAIDGEGQCRNSPDDVLWDVRIAEAIVSSAREKRTVAL